MPASLKSGLLNKLTRGVDAYQIWNAQLGGWPSRIAGGAVMAITGLWTWLGESWLPMALVATGGAGLLIRFLPTAIRLPLAYGRTSGDGVLTSPAAPERADSPLTGDASRDEDRPDILANVVDGLSDKVGRLDLLVTKMHRYTRSRAFLLELDILDLNDDIETKKIIFADDSFAVSNLIQDYETKMSRTWGQLERRNILSSDRIALAKKTACDLVESDPRLWTASDGEVHSAMLLKKRWNTLKYQRRELVRATKEVRKKLEQEIKLFEEGPWPYRPLL